MIWVRLEFAHLFGALFGFSFGEVVFTSAVHSAFLLRRTIVTVSPHRQRTLRRVHPLRRLRSPSLPKHRLIHLLAFLSIYSWWPLIVPAALRVEQRAFLILDRR